MVKSARVTSVDQNKSNKIMHKKDSCYYYAHKNYKVHQQ